MENDKKAEETLAEKYLNVIKKIGNISKDAENPFAKANYASLTKILKTVQPISSTLRQVVVSTSWPRKCTSRYNLTSMLSWCERTSTLMKLYGCSTMWRRTWMPSPTVLKPSRPRGLSTLRWIGARCWSTGWIK